jgi:hypothetical protein
MTWVSPEIAGTSVADLGGNLLKMNSAPKSKGSSQKRSASMRRRRQIQKTKGAPGEASQRQRKNTTTVSPQSKPRRNLKENKQPYTSEGPKSKAQAYQEPDVYEDEEDAPQHENRGEDTPPPHSDAEGGEEPRAGEITPPQDSLEEAKGSKGRVTFIQSEEPRHESSSFHHVPTPMPPHHPPSSLSPSMRQPDLESPVFESEHKIELEEAVDEELEFIQSKSLLESRYDPPKTPGPKMPLNMTTPDSKDPIFGNVDFQEMNAEDYAARSARRVRILPNGDIVDDISWHEYKVKLKDYTAAVSAFPGLRSPVKTPSRSDFTEESLGLMSAVGSSLGPEEHKTTEEQGSELMALESNSPASEEYKTTRSSNSSPESFKSAHPGSASNEAQTELELEVPVEVSAVSRSSRIYKRRQRTAESLSKRKLSKSPSESSSRPSAKRIKRS